MVAIHLEDTHTGDRSALARRTTWALVALLAVAAWTSLAVGAREQQTGGPGGSLEPPGPFPTTSIQCVWSIMSALLPS